MAQKIEILHEVGWDTKTNAPEYERLTTVKNEQAAISFVNDLDNIGIYGNMIARIKHGGSYLVYNERSEKWE